MLHALKKLLYFSHKMQKARSSSNKDPPPNESIVVENKLKYRLKYQNGSASLVLTYPGCPGKKAVKQM